MKLATSSPSGSSRMWCAIHQAFLAERMLETNKVDAEGDQRLPGLAERLPGRKDGGPHAQDRSSQSYYEHDYEGLMAVLKRNSKKLAIDPARREPEPRAEFEGSMGKLGPLLERTLANG